MLVEVAGEMGCVWEGRDTMGFLRLTRGAKEGKEEYKCLCLCFSEKERSSPKKSP